MLVPTVGDRAPPVHLVLTPGGMFMDPRDTKDPTMAGKLDLICEVKPVSMIVEQAGGASLIGCQRILDMQPESLHQRVPAILGSRNEVKTAVSCHATPERGRWRGACGSRSMRKEAPQRGASLHVDLDPQACRLWKYSLTSAAFHVAVLVTWSTPPDTTTLLNIVTTIWGEMGMLAG